MKNIEYGYSDVAEASGKTEGAVRVDASRKKFKMENLRSTAVYIAAEILKKETQHGRH